MRTKFLLVGEEVDKACSDPSGVAMGWAGWAMSPECRGSRVPGQKLTKKIIFPLQRVKLLTDLQMLGCELHKNAFGGRAPPRPAGAAIALPRLPGRYRGKERERRGGKVDYR